MLGTAAPLAAATALICSDDLVEWLPKYGCALLALKGPRGSGQGMGLAQVQDVRARQANERLLLVCLDNWSFRVHW